MPSGGSSVKATIQAKNDEVIEGEHDCVFSFTTASADAQYNGINKSYAAKIIDNDGQPTLSIVVSQDSHLREGNLGYSNIYSVVHGSEEPTQPLKMTVWTDKQCALKKPSGNYGSQLTVEIKGYAVPITVVANDDEIAEGDHTCHLQHLLHTNDPAYKYTVISSRYVTIEDNDGPAPAAATTASDDQGQDLGVSEFVEFRPASAQDFGGSGQLAGQPLRVQGPDSINQAFVVITVVAVAAGAALGWRRYGRLKPLKNMIDKS